MALNNPAFSNPAFQDPKAVQTYPGGRQAAGLTPPPAPTQFSTAQGAATDAAAQAHLEGMYAAPAAGAIETDRMSIEDTVWKTVGLFAILLVTAAVGWVWTMAGVSAQNPNPSIAPWIIGALGGFVLAMVVIFTSRKKVRPALIFAYAAFEGLFVGGISAFFEFIWPGIVVQATLATFSVVGVTLALFASGKIRASKKATKIFLIAMVGYLVFSLINIGMMMFGAPIAGGPFGMLSQTVMGIPLGLIIGVLVVIMAAYSLVLDFDQIQRGVRNGAPRQFGWVGAFGIMVTVVWLYVEILRILAILRGDN
ncbi:Bax inhibitor-1/YccA family membrane protein [Microbacterium cremeum]|uniref:Bax inhibitor-1/YccA family protein n=1 Tax=Microbacterium cremeum TaxID=2782169 RepID=UPI0018879CD0|nr:Bax inhibitor-1/YccA family protein [Microbacterium cremeum]